MSGGLGSRTTTPLAELGAELRANAERFSKTGDHLDMALVPILDDAADAVARCVRAEEALRLLRESVRKAAQAGSDDVMGFDAIEFEEAFADLSRLAAVGDTPPKETA